MSDDVFAVLDEDRESELRGEKAFKEQEPFSPALLVDVSIDKNFFGNNCLSIILVKPNSHGKYWHYDVEIIDKKTMDDLKKNEDEKSKKRLAGLNLSIRNVNIHLYELTGTDRKEPTAKAFEFLQTSLKEASLEVDIDFTPKPGPTYTNHYFKDIKCLGPKDLVNPSIIALIKDDLKKRKDAQTKKQQIEKPNQFYEEVVNKF